MRKFMFGLIAAAILAQIPVPTQASDINPITMLDLRNKSDQCVEYDVAAQRGTIQPGHFAHIYVDSAWVSSMRKVIARIVNCSTRALIVEEYIYIPTEGRSYLIVQKQGSTYVMRHGS